MKIAIMTDIEGVGGLVNFKDWCCAGSRYYEQGKELLTNEVNAAIRGFCDAGATDIVVIDGHGSGAINTMLLDERAEYSRGWAENSLFELDRGWDGLAFVGQHAKAGTVRSHITHTQHFDVLESRINGVSVGEYGESVLRAGHYGTPVIFASGERALCEEAKALTPWVHTAETKYGVTPDDGRSCDTDEYENHNLGAVHVHPNVARRRIYEGAKAALEDLKANPEKFKSYRMDPPYVQEVWYRKWGDRPAHKMIRRHESNVGLVFYGEQEILNAGEYKMPWEE